jgi:CubicO group peptidase (beta-lactamase class C family)
MPKPPQEKIQGKDPFENYGREQLLKDLRSIQLQSKPGEKFSYSNLGFATLGLVIEKVTGQSFRSVVTKFVYSEKLKSTMVDVTAIGEKRKTQGFSGGKQIDYITLDAMAPAGILKSSAADMIAYAKSLFLQQGKTAPLVEKITFTDANNLHVGLSWLIRDTVNGQIYFHNGGTTGYRSFLGFDPKSGKALVILSNSVADVTSLGFSLMKLLYQDEKSQNK